VSSLLLLPDESRIVAGHDDGSVSLWHPGDCVCVATLRATSHKVIALAADPAGRWLAAGDVQAAVVLFRASAVDEPFAARLERVDSIAATWLDDGLRREAGTRSSTLVAIAAQQQLDARLRDLMARVEQLRPVMTWETLAEALHVANEPHLPASRYERALRLAVAALEWDADIGIGHLLAVLAMLRLERWHDVLRQVELAQKGKRNRTEISFLHAASAMALHRLGRRDDARAELARMESSLEADVQEADLARLAAEARRMVAR
jgi:hypothetical protein